MTRRADDQVISFHARNIVRMPLLADRRKAIDLFSDNYGSAATEKLKKETERLWPLRNSEQPT